MSVEEKIAQWVGQFPTSAIDERIAELEAEADAIGKQYIAVKNEIKRFQQYAQMREGLLPAVGISAREASEHAVQKADELFSLKAEQPKHRSDQVLAIFGGARKKSMTVQEINDELVRRGWLEDSDNGRHSLQVTLSKMTRKNPPQIRRVRMGVYRLPRPDPGLEFP